MDNDFPQEFGLKSFYGDLFRVKESYQSGETTQIVVQIFVRGMWMDFARENSVRLKSQIVTSL